MVSQSKRESERGWTPLKMRFSVAVAVLISMGLVAIVAQKFISSESYLLRFIGGLAVLLLGFFAHEWIWVHSNALTRQKRAHFDEANILETYQPRARTHGHLFQPDPPTPGPIVKFADNGENQGEPSGEKNAFNANRDAHYANMFAYAMRVAKEQEAITKEQEAMGKEKEAMGKEQAAKSPVTTAKSSRGSPPNDKASNSTRTALPKEDEVKAQPKSPIKSPVDKTQRPESIEEFTAIGDTNDKGEPLYENINPGEELPTVPKPSAVERLRSSMGQVAQLVAKNVSSKVRTALENSSSYRGPAPGSLRGSTPSVDEKKADGEQ